MKVVLALTTLLLVTTSTFAAEYVRGYTKSNGTYVEGYTRSSPDSSYNNNYGVKGNTNPNTGSQGTASPTYNDRTPTYNTKTYGDPGYTTSNPYGTTSTPRYRGY